MAASRLLACAITVFVVGCASSDEVQEGALWFEGARLNYAEHLLGGEGVALVARSQTRDDVELSFALPPVH